MSTDITTRGQILKERTVTANGTQVLIRKMEDDPICLRVSMGGDEGPGFYLVYRGDLKTVREMLKTCWLGLEQFEE